MNVRYVVIVTAYVQRYWPNENTQRHLREVPEDATIQELIDALPTEHLSRVEIDRYFKVNNRVFGTGSWNISHLLSNGRLLHDVPYEDARLRDFFQTYDVADRSIYIATGLQGRGGGGGWAHEVWTYWPHILFGLQLLSNIKDVFEVTHVIASQATTRLHRRKLPPMPIEIVEDARSFFDVLIRRDCWNASELAERTGMPKDSTIHILHACAYIYDNRRKQFVVSDETPLRIAVLNGAEWKAIRVAIRDSGDTN